MKYLLITAIALISNSASACPDLSGHFLCKAFTNGKDQDITMSQVVENNVTTYTMTILVKDEKPSVRKYTADNIERPLARDGYATYTNQAACVGNDLQVRIKGKGSDAEHPDQDGLVIIRIDNNNNMYDSYRGKWGTNPDRFIDETCQRVH